MHEIGNLRPHSGEVKRKGSESLANMREGNWLSDALGLSVRAVEFEFKEGGCRRIIRKDHEDL